MTPALEEEKKRLEDAARESWGRAAGGFSGLGLAGAGALAGHALALRGGAVPTSISALGGMLLGGAAGGALGYYGARPIGRHIGEQIGRSEFEDQLGRIRMLEALTEAQAHREPMNKTAYAHGQEAAFKTFKLAKYMTETDSLERKMRRHMQADPEQEKTRLKEKGRAEGSSTGKVVGGVTGGLGGAALGGALGHALHHHHPAAGILGLLAGGAAGAGLGAWGGGAYGGSVGARAGETEFNDREDLANTLRDMDPNEQRRRIEHLINTRRDEERMQMEQERLDLDRARYYDSMSRRRYHDDY